MLTYGILLLYVQFLTNNLIDVPQEGVILTSAR
jgi:hypothetical protein